MQYDVVEDDTDIIVTEEEVEDEVGKVPTYASTTAHSHNLRGKDIPTHIERGVEVDETIVLKERSPRFWRTLLTGMPSPTSSLLSLLTLLLNLALIGGVTDMVYRAKTFHPSHDLSFARLGYVSTTEANLLIREPHPSELPIYVSYRLADPAPNENNAWQSTATISSLGNDTDYTAAVVSQSFLTIAT